MIIETTELVAQSNVMSAKRMKEMADEISRLEMPRACLGSYLPS